MIQVRHLWHRIRPQGAWCRIGDRRVFWRTAAWCAWCGALGYEHEDPAAKAEAEQHGEAGRPRVVPCDICEQPTCDACAEPTWEICMACYREGPQ